MMSSLPVGDNPSNPGGFGGGGRHPRRRGRQSARRIGKQPRDATRAEAHVLITPASSRGVRIHLPRTLDVPWRTYPQNLLVQLTIFHLRRLLSVASRRPEPTSF